MPKTVLQSKTSKKVAAHISGSLVAPSDLVEWQYLNFSKCGRSFSGGPLKERIKAPVSWTHLKVVIKANIWPI